MELVDTSRVPGWHVATGQSRVQIWQSNTVDKFTNKRTPAYAGNQFIELNAMSISKIYQDFSTPSPTIFTIHFAHRGRLGTDICRVYAGRPGGATTTIIEASDGNMAWGLYNASYIVPAGQTTTRFTFQALNTIKLDSVSKRQSMGSFLDDIEITANNGIIGSNQLAAPCLSSEVQVPVGGVGTWLQDPHNPSETRANLASNGTDNITSISGFKVSGVYRYVWKTAYCKSPLTITVSGGGLEKPIVSLASPIHVGGILQLTTAAVPNAIYTWTGPNGFSSDQLSPIVSTNANSKLSGIYTLIVSVNGCESPPSSINIMINSNPENRRESVLDTLGSNVNASTRPIKKIAVSASTSVALKPKSELLRPIDGYYKKEIVQGSKVAARAVMREADVMYSKRIWREIDLREKINQVFAAPQARLIDILLDAVNSGELTAYDPISRKGDLGGDEFSAILSPQQVMTRLADSVLVPILDKSGNIIGTNVKPGEFNPDSVLKFRIKEDWIFDKQRSVFEPRVIGIAPMIRIKAAGQSLDDQPAFWIYFPQARPILATKAVANRKNDASHLSYDDLFMKRIFSSYIVKESNVEDIRIKDYMQGVDRLYESERIKKELMDYEHDLWSY